jgi:hypothetical protein
LTIARETERRNRMKTYAYREILPLRTESSASTVFLIDGVDRDHQATDVLR